MNACDSLADWLRTTDARLSPPRLHIFESPNSAGRQPSCRVWKARTLCELVDALMTDAANYLIETADRG